jgi:hypothetical protein
MLGFFLFGHNLDFWAKIVAVCHIFFIKLLFITSFGL